MTGIQKAFVLVLFLMASMVVYHLKKGRDLTSNRKTTLGEYIKYHQGVKTGGGLEFTYEIDGRLYSDICCQHLPTACEQGLMANEAALRQYLFTVVYDSTDITNAELLVTRSQYYSFNVEVPENLSDLIEIISVCE